MKRRSTVRLIAGVLAPILVSYLFLAILNAYLPALLAWVKNL